MKIVWTFMHNSNMIRVFVCINKEQKYRD